MDIFTLIIWIITFSFLVFSFFKDREKTKRHFNGISHGPYVALSIFTIVITIGLLLTLLPPERIASFVSGQHVITATLGAALIGTVTPVPAFIAFPSSGHCRAQASISSLSCLLDDTDHGRCCNAPLRTKGIWHEIHSRPQCRKFCRRGPDRFAHGGDRMKILKFLRKHPFQIAILLIYVILFFVRKEFALNRPKIVFTISGKCSSSCRSCSS